MKSLRLFLSAYTAYRTCHSPLYAVRIAYGIAFRGLPF